eukprot:scaffold823_cov397-Prasinococcus_capsulatus_cf.AAC.16
MTTPTGGSSEIWRYATGAVCAQQVSSRLLQLAVRCRVPQVTLVSTEDGGNADTKTYDLKWATPAVIDGTPFDQIGWGGFKVFAELVVPLIDCDDKPPKDQSSSIHIELQTGEESWARTSYPVYITFYAGPETDAQRKTEMLFESVEKSTSVVRDYSLSFTPRMIDLRASSTNGAKIDVFAMSVNGVEIDLSWAFPILIDGRPYGSTVDPQTGVGYTLAATNVHILSLNQCDLPALVYMPCLGVAWECPESGVVDVYTNVQCASGLDQGSYLQFSQGQVTYGCIDQSDASATASADGGKKNYAFDDIVPAVGVDTCYFFAAASAKCNEDGSECSGDCVDIFGGKAKYDNIPQGYVDIAGTSWGKSTADNHYELKVGDATLQFGSQLSCADVGSTLSSAELVNKLLNDLPWQKSCEAYGLDAPSRFKGSSDSSDCDQSNGGLIAAVIIPWLIIAGASGYLGYIYWQKRKYGGGKPYTTGLDDIDMLHEPMIPN